MHAWRVVRYGDLDLVGSFRVACRRPERIQLVAVGLDICRNAQASSSVRLCDSMVTPNKKPALGGLCSFDGWFTSWRSAQPFQYTEGHLPAVAGYFARDRSGHVP